MKSLLAVSVVLGWIMCGAAAEKPRVFITDSKSWDISGGVGGTQDGFGGATICYIFQAARSVSSVISGGTPIRTGIPKVPRPRFT